MARLIVVSNRVAVPSADGGDRAGGLAVAVRSVLKQHHGIWFGWSGTVSTDYEAETRVVVEDDITYVVADLLADDYQEYYTGFANRVLWPILHYRLDLAEFSRRDLSGYRRVNAHFAKQLEAILQPDDLIWVHDYHLIPLAKMLRDRGHRNPIGFFLHVPFPPPDILTALPHHEWLIPQLGSYDLVGFQTQNDASNFMRYLETEISLVRCGEASYRNAHDEIVRVGIFPIGILAEEFNSLARSAQTSATVQELKASLFGRALMIGVDRLDYSKGLAQRMDAYNRFLSIYPDWHGRVIYLQITPKSRSEIQEYVAIEQTVGETAGRINGAFGQAAWTPIRYVNSTYGRSDLAGFFRIARVGLVTPLRDGMNLVAKEYIAAQDADDPGVLILSRFAGAAAECTQALLVNPYDTEAVATSIAQALSMPLEERRSRHAALYRNICANDLASWGKRFLHDLTCADRGSTPTPASVPLG
ncbi:MAG: alpha,alpha-trehalose-phosphate synthase (UDP-forming) [Hyphomicrobiales bacterium]|nr:alpha,alpha-trehalose-phosphate synthase (UDP-forming) [Hyphomicrobiales bacterium]